MELRGVDIFGNWDGFTDYTPDYSYESAYADVPLQDPSLVFVGNDFSSATNPVPSFGSTILDNPNYDGGQNMTSAQLQEYIRNSANIGATVTPEIAAKATASGLDLANIVTAAGAAWKLVQQANGVYVAQPTNAAAQAVVAKRAQQSKMLMIAAAGLAAFVVLRK